MTLVLTLEREIGLLAEEQLCPKFLDPLLESVVPLLAVLNVASHTTGITRSRSCRR